jgi:hypothetical protein
MSTFNHNIERGATMCRAVTCRTCSKTTWAGCGQHVDQVMRGVPKDQRCLGHEDERPAGPFARFFGRRTALG